MSTEVPVKLLRICTSEQLHEQLVKNLKQLEIKMLSEQRKLASLEVERLGVEAEFRRLSEIADRLNGDLNRWKSKQAELKQRKLDVENLSDKEKIQLSVEGKFHSLQAETLQKTGNQLKERSEDQGHFEMKLLEAIQQCRRNLNEMELSRRSHTDQLSQLDFLPTETSLKSTKKSSEVSQIQISWVHNYLILSEWITSTRLSLSRKYWTSHKDTYARR